MPMRVYTAGRVWLETDDGRLVPERNLPGRQGRVLLVALALDRDHPLSRDELADRLWPQTLPSAWEPALDVLVSKLRSALRAADPGASVRTADGCHQLALPAGAVVDRESAVTCVDTAEGALARGDVAAAWAAAAVASSILRRPLLAGVQGAWVDRQRRLQQWLLVRALSCLHDVWMARGNYALAVRAAVESVELEPFRETGYRQLMSAHAAAGDRAEAIRVFERCRRLLAVELGAEPSSATRQALDRLQDAHPRG